MVAGDWYSAAEALLECLRQSPAHAEASAALAECYYELGEFDQALNWVRKARALARGSLELANLEAFTLIALGRLEAAESVIAWVLSREPYNREALFAQGELDIAQGRAGDAVTRYREAARRYPDDRRLLVSLALVLGSLGDTAGALSAIDRALLAHPGDYRICYYAGYLNAKAGNFPAAIRYTEQALFYRNGYGPARTLLASLRYRSGQYEEAARLADESIAADRTDIGAWYLKGLSYIRLRRTADALGVLSAAAMVDPEDEFVRTALEETLLGSTGLEDPLRRNWSAQHFARGQDFRSRNLIDQALFEYRRGLRLNPFARERRDYAELLRIRGYPARFLEELRVLQEQGMEDSSLADAVETYDALLSDALFRRWSVDPVELFRRHWKVAVFSVNSQSAFYHADAGAVASAYIRDILAHHRNIQSLDVELRQPSFSQAFRTAREAGADYFLVISVSEGERDLSLQGELFVGRTGAPALSVSSFKTGTDRLRNAALDLVEQTGGALPFRGSLVQRRAAQGLIDKGRADGVAAETVYEIVKQGRSVVKNEGIGLSYSEDDVVGTLVVERVDEEVSSGLISRRGFFDRVAPGDEIILQPQAAETGPPAETAADPELRTLLRTLR
jgi:tetratricopeptide (TPR) repeat protein